MSNIEESCPLEERGLLVKNLKPSDVCLKSSFECFHYHTCLKSLTIDKEVQRRMWDHLCRHTFHNGSFISIGYEDIDHFLEEDHFNLDVAMGFYTLVAACIGTNDEGHLNDCSAEFLVSW